MKIIVDEKGNVDHKAQLEVYQAWKDIIREIKKPKLTLIKNKRYIKS